MVGSDPYAVPYEPAALYESAAWYEPEALYEPAVPYVGEAVVSAAGSADVPGVLRCGTPDGAGKSWPR